jgi:hypothetical protein
MVGGSNNVAVGQYALCASTANSQTAIGFYAMKQNTTGTSNTSVGFCGLQANTSGQFNTAIGDSALLSNTIGTHNTAVGESALRLNTTGQPNTAIGKNALRNNTTGQCNVAVGYNALFSNCANGRYNVAVGNDALCANTSGIENVAVGIDALLVNTTGVRNVAIGACSSCASTTGECNTAVGAFSMCLNTIGIRNTAIGFGALCSNTTGTNHTAVGFRAQNAINANIANTIAVGCSAVTSATSNHTVWGNASNNVCNCVYAAWSNVSDCRDKTNIETLPDELGLSLIKRIRPVKYNWDHRDAYVLECNYEYGTKDGSLISQKEHYGLVAQELRDALSELNVRFDALGHDTEKDAYRMTYEELIAPIIKAIQEIDDRLIILENKVG